MTNFHQTPKFLNSSDGQKFDVFGASMLYKATADDTRGAYSLAIETTLPHAGLPLHVHHREDEAMFILEGEYEIQCGEKTFRATLGAFIFLPRGLQNRYENVSDAPGRFLHIVSPGGFEKLVEKTSKIEVKSVGDMETVKNLSKEYGVDFL